MGAKEKTMGNQLVWNERYNIGVEVIDKEHKKIVQHSEQII